MPYVIAAIVMIGAVSFLNLVLTLGVIRRLREHTALLRGGAAGAGPGTDKTGIQAGETPQDFAVTTETGQMIARSDLAGLTLVGFLTPTCPPCREQVKPFLDYAVNQLPGGHANAIAVVLGAPGETGELAAELAPAARVVVEHLGRPGESGETISAAFGVHLFPAFFLIDNGVVVASGVTVAQLPAPVAAAA